MKKTLLIGILLVLVAAVALAAVAPKTSAKSMALTPLKATLTVRCEKNPSSGMTGYCQAKVSLFDNTKQHNWIAMQTTQQFSVGSTVYHQTTFKNLKPGVKYYLIANGIGTYSSYDPPKVFFGKTTTNALTWGQNIVTMSLNLIDVTVIE